MRSYDLSPRPPPPLSRQPVVSLSQSSCVTPIELTDGRGGRGGRGAKSYDREKAWPSINQYSLGGGGEEGGRGGGVILLQQPYLYKTILRKVPMMYKNVVIFSAV